MKKIISFSGGKDSTALILWAKENLEVFETVFCDTNWEHPITYKYIEYINKALLGGVIGWYVRDWYQSEYINELEDKNMKLINRTIRITTRMKFYKNG